MIKRILNFLWDKSLAFGGYLLLLAVYVDYRTSLSINITGMIVTYTLWSILSLIMTRKNAVLNKLWSDIKNKDWELIQKYIIMGFNLKTSINLNTLLYIYILVNVIYFIYQVVEPIYAALGLSVNDLLNETNIVIEIALFNACLAILGTALHGIIQNVEKELLNERYDGHRA